MLRVHSAVMQVCQVCREVATAFAQRPMVFTSVQLKNSVCALFFRLASLTSTSHESHLLHARSRDDKVDCNNQAGLLRHGNPARSMRKNPGFARYRQPCLFKQRHVHSLAIETSASPVKPSCALSGAAVPTLQDHGKAAVPGLRRC